MWGWDPRGVFGLEVGGYGLESRFRVKDVGFGGGSGPEAAGHD